MSNIQIKNTSSATVVLSIPELRFRRELVPGRVIGVSKEEYEEMSFDPGFNTMVRDHYITVTGVDESEAVVESNESVFDEKAIAKMFDEQNVTAFAQFIPTAAPAEKETVVKLAVEKGITNGGFTALIQKYCGVDVIGAINTKHLAEA